MIGYLLDLLARLCRTDWTAPLDHAPTEPVDQAAQLYELAAWEQDIREDERRLHVRQQDTASGAPPRRIGLYTEISQ